jgi:hypothetical protein
VVSNLAMVANDQSAETQRRAGKLRADLQYGDIDEILATGLHAFLTQFLDRVNELGGASAATSWFRLRSRVHRHALRRARLRKAAGITKRSGSIRFCRPSRIRCRSSLPWRAAGAP